MKEKIIWVGKKAIAALLFVTVAWLALVSFYSTSSVTGKYETIGFSDDSVALNLFAAALFSICLCLIYRWGWISAMEKRLENIRTFICVRKILLWSLAVLAAIWVFATQVKPITDSELIMQAAAGLHDREYDMFAPGAYIDTSPNQIGIVCIWYLLSFLFGSGNYLAFQTLNVAALVLAYRELSEISGIFGLGRLGQLTVIVLGILFFPLILYCSFTYGNLAGLAFSLLAIRHELLFFRLNRKKDAVFCALSIALAVMLKQNYLITLIAMMICAAVELIRDPKWGRLLLPALILLCVWFQSAVPSALVKRATGYPLDQGMSSWSFIVMGLQGDGWWDGYNNETYTNSGYQKEIQAETAKERIREILAEFGQDPAHAARFFARKAESEWNNPTFQGFWIAQFRPSDLNYSAPIEWLLNGEGQDKVTVFLNYLQSIILTGAFLGCCTMFFDRRWADGACVFALVFIGGFLFHLVWEAKAQYTVTYFVLLFPFTVRGYSALAEKICFRKAQSSGGWA